MNIKKVAASLKESGTLDQKDKFKKYLSNLKENEEIEADLSALDISAEPEFKKSNDAVAIELMSTLKVEADNIRILHRHLVGANWFGDHEKLAEYYEKIDSFEDAVVEMFIAKSIKEPTIKEAIEGHDILEVKDYSNDEAFTQCRNIFIHLRALIENVKNVCELEKDLVSKLEEFQYWLYLESEYKLAQRLNQNKM